MKKPENKRTIENEIKKSKFIATVEPINKIDDIKLLIKEIKKKHPKANHVVYAFFLNDERSISGLSDDGEPHGTAGRPVYEVLKGSGLTDVLLIITRYFGGTKLGTGGLVSAYGQSAQDVLMGLKTIEKVYTVAIELQLNYKIYENVKKFLIDEGVLDFEESFSTEITLKAKIPIDKKDNIERTIKDISHGKIIVRYPKEGKN